MTRAGYTLLRRGCVRVLVRDDVVTRLGPWLAAGLALLIILPNLLWQWQHNFPVVRHMEELARFVAAKLKEVYAHSPNITPLKAAILTAVNFADEMQKMKREYSAICRTKKYSN